MDPKTKKFIVSRDVVFDEVSSWYFAQKLTLQNIDSDHDQDNVELLPETNSQVSQNRQQESDGSLAPSSSEDGGDQVTKKSTREKRQPTYLKDYVQLNHCTVTACLFTGVLQEGEPICYEEAKGYLEWEEAMQEEIEALKKNET